MKMDKRTSEDGFYILNDYFDKNKVDLIRKKVDFFFEKNLHLGEAVNIKHLSDEELKTYGAARDAAVRKNPNFFIDKKILNSGLDNYKDLTNGRSVTDPLYNIPEILDFATSDTIIEYAQNYLGSKLVKIGFIKLRRFFTNNNKEFDTNYFHYDDNSKKLFKSIIHLSDIESEEDGPFVYVKGSHQKKINESNKNTINKYMRTDDEIQQFYGQENIVNCLGKKGSVILADTLGYHKGTKNTSKDRYVLYINYVLEEEYSGTGLRQKISSEVLSKSKKYESLFEYFKKV